MPAVEALYADWSSRGCAQHHPARANRQPARQGNRIAARSSRPPIPRGRHRSRGRRHRGSRRPLMPPHHQQQQYHQQQQQQYHQQQRHHHQRHQAKAAVERDDLPLRIALLRATGSTLRPMRIGPSRTRPAYSGGRTNRFDRCLRPDSPANAG